MRKLANDPSVELVLVIRSELDLTRQTEVEAFPRDVRVDEVYAAAAVVGGIGANVCFPVEFIHQNL